MWCDVLWIGVGFERILLLADTSTICFSKKRSGSGYTHLHSQQQARSNRKIWLATLEAAPKAQITDWFWSSEIHNKTDDQFCQFIRFELCRIWQTTQLILRCGVRKKWVLGSLLLISVWGSTRIKHITSHPEAFFYPNVECCTNVFTQWKCLF